jgi:hypothetical protein
MRTRFSHAGALATAALGVLLAASGAAAAHGAGSQQAEIRILSPRDGDEIVLFRDEVVPAERPVRGDVVGFTKETIESLGLRVEVSIRTDKWYPQGIAAVRGDGSWGLQKAYFGGAVHHIRAILKDRHGNERATTTITVTLIQ